MIWNKGSLRNFKCFPVKDGLKRSFKRCSWWGQLDFNQQNCIHWSQRLARHKAGQWPPDVNVSRPFKALKVINIKKENWKTKTKKQPVWVRIRALCSRLNVSYVCFCKSTDQFKLDISLCGSFTFVSSISCLNTVYTLVRFRHKNQASGNIMFQSVSSSESSRPQHFSTKTGAVGWQ